MSRTALQPVPLLFPWGAVRCAPTPSESPVGSYTPRLAVVPGGLTPRQGWVFGG